MRRALAAAAALALALAAQPRPAAAISVFDGANYVQNALAAARALLMIDSLLDQLAQQIRLVEGMELDLRPLGYSGLEELRAHRADLEALLGGATAAPWSVDGTAARHGELFPAAPPAGAARAERLQAERGRGDAAREGWRHGLEVQAGVVEGMAASEGLLDELVGRSQAARGGLEARQAGNQIMALSVREQLRLQALVAAGGRGAALEGARMEAASRAARARFADSIGDGVLYAPEP